VTRSRWRWAWLLLVVGGAVLVLASGALLIVACDGARHGWASWRHAAPYPLAGSVVGLALVTIGIVAIVRRR
jgi:hypothetical protein